MPSFPTSLTAKLLGAGLVLALIVGLWLRGERLEAQRDKERAAHALTVANVKRAQDQALAGAVAARNAAEARYAALAKRTDQDAQTALSDAQRRAADFVARNRVVRTEAAGCPPRAAPPAAQGRGARVPEASPGDAVVVAADDIRICTDNSVKLNAAHEWALSLAP